MAEGEIVTIIGANGAGKSSLLKAISGVVRLSAGSIDLLRRAHRPSGRGGHRRKRTGPDPGGTALFGPLTVEREPGAGRTRAAGGAAVL